MGSRLRVDAERKLLLLACKQCVAELLASEQKALLVQLLQRGGLARACELPRHFHRFCSVCQRTTTFKQRL